MFKTKKASEPTEKDLLKEEKAPQAAPQREKPPAQHAIIPADLKITGDLVSTGDIHVEGAIHAGRKRGQGTSSKATGGDPGGHRLVIG